MGTEPPDDRYALGAADGSTIVVVGRRRLGEDWQADVELCVVAFAGWGEPQHVPGDDSAEWVPQRYAVRSEDGEVLMRGEMIDTGAALTTGDVPAPDRPLEAGEPWHFIVPRPVE